MALLKKPSVRHLGWKRLARPRQYCVRKIFGDSSVVYVNPCKKERCRVEGITAASLNFTPAVSGLDSFRLA
jgi:hypothetical protein